MRTRRCVRPTRPAAGEVRQARLVLGEQGERIAGQCGEFVGERHRRAGASAVHDGERSAASCRIPDHGEDRCDPDAAGEEQIGRGLREPEVVARPAYRERCTGAGELMEFGGTAPTHRLSQNADAPLRGIGRVTAQGVLTQSARGQTQLDVCAGPPRGSSTPSGSPRPTAMTPSAAACTSVT